VKTTGRRMLGLGLLPAREGGRAEAVAGRGGWQRHTCTSPKRQRRWLASAGPTRPSPHRPAAALAVQGVGVRGAGEGVRGPRGEGAGVQSRGGDGAAAPNDEERRSCQPAMVDPRRRRKREVRETMNGHGFVKRMARRCRGRRDLPRGGGGGRRNATVWPKKLAEEFTGNLAFSNFGVRSAVIGVADRETGCTSGILASRATPAYIYIRRVWIFWKSEIF